MTSSHAAKTAIRERMARTGETYSTARKNLLQEPDLPSAPTVSSAQAAMALSLSHIPDLSPLLVEGRHLIITGRSGGGKSVTLDALMKLAEAEAYLTPAKLDFRSIPAPFTNLTPWDEILSLTAPKTGYSAFRDEAEQRFPGRPTICTMQSFVLDRDDIQQAPLDTTVVLVQWLEGTRKVTVLGVRKIEEIWADRGQMPILAALMDPAIRGESDVYPW